MPNRPMAVEKVAAVFGGNSRLAEICGRSRAAPRYWPNGVPAEHVLAVEKASNGKLSRHDLRPDIYPREVRKGGKGRNNGRKKH